MARANFVKRAAARFASTAPAPKPSFSWTPWLLYGGMFAAGAATAQAVPLFTLYELFLEPLPTPNTPNAVAFAAKLEAQLQALPLVRELSADPAYTLHRAWEGIDSNVLEASMVGGTLSVPGGFAIKPILFVNRTTDEAVAVVHAGRKLCGYPFLFHGGILATILDEMFKKTAAVLRFDGDKAKVKTDLLTLSYRSPTAVDQFLVIRAKIEGDEAAELAVNGVVENIKGRLLVKGLLRFKSPAMVTSATRKWYYLYLH